MEIPGVGHLALGKPAVLIVSEIERFLTDVWEAGGWQEREPDRVLATVLFTDIVESTAKAIELGDRTPPVAGVWSKLTTAWVLYGPKASGGWPGSGTSLVGPAGPGEDPVHIQVSDATTQSIAVANTFQNVTWSTNGDVDGFVHVPGTAQILVPRSGVYRINVSIPIQRIGLLAPTSIATACLAVNAVNVVCQSAGFDASDLPHAVPLTTIASLVSGDVITLRVKSTSTSIQVSGGVDSTIVITIASVD